MTKQQILDALMLLSALESWAFSERKTLPDYLSGRIKSTVNVMSKMLIEETIECDGLGCGCRGDGCTECDGSGYL